MSGLSKICRRSSGLWVLAFLAAGLWTQTPARGADEVVSISVDQAQLLNLPDRVATIIIGNPLIADATVQGGGILVVTGKGYGMLWNGQKPASNSAGLSANFRACSGCLLICRRS